MNASRYRAPLQIAAALGAMLMTAEAIADVVARSHETMRAEVERLVTAQDRARRLLLGCDEFADAWRAEPADTDGDSIDVMAGAIAGAAKLVGAVDMNAWPAPVLHYYVRRLAEADISHPLVAHREVLRAACHAMGQSAPDWSDIDAFVDSKRVLNAGPQVGQPCWFYPADGSEPRAGTVTHVWGPGMVNLRWEEQGAPAAATSVRVLRVPEPDARYYCVLEPELRAEPQAQPAW